MFQLVSLLTPVMTFRDFARSFSGNGVHQPASELIFTTLGLVVAIGLGYTLWMRLYGNAGHRGAGITDMPEEIVGILDQAMENRSRIDISFHATQGNRQTIACSLSDLSRGVTLELPPGINPSQSWTGREMDCYFRVPRKNRTPYFYRFVSTIASIEKKGAFEYLILKTPDRVELGQKRKHLRLSLPATDIQNFRLWSATETSTFHFETDQSKWPEPLARYDQRIDSGVRIMDISGGGIRLSFDPDRYSGIEDFVSRHPVLFMYLELAPTSGLTFPPYYVAARLRTKLQDYDSGAFMLGYEFVECSTSGLASDSLDWIKIEPERGIDDLVTWIFKRHLELYRERDIV